MQRPTLAKEIMITRLLTVSPEMDVFEAIQLLLKHRVSGAPVIDAEGTFYGVLSEGSCMSLVVESAYGQLPTTQVRAFMNDHPQTITDETDLLTIAQIFRSSSHRRLPVLKEGKLVGQISRRDVLEAAHRMIHLAPEDENALLYLSSIRARDDAPIE